MNLYRDQKKALSEFFGNMSVAWLAAGIIAPYIAGKNFTEVIQETTTSLLYAGIFIILMLYFSRGGRK